MDNLNHILSQTRSELEHYKLQLQQANGKIDESAGLLQSYKQQIVECRDKIRKLESSAKKIDASEVGIATMKNEMSIIQQENNRLKAQLFDQLSSTSSNADATLKQAYQQMKAVADAKDQENKELMQICEDLMRQLEAAKGAS